MNKALVYLDTVCLQGKPLTVDKATRESYEKSGSIDRVISATTIKKAHELECVIRKVLGREIKSQFVPDESRDDGRGDLLVEMSFCECQKIHSSWDVIRAAMA